MESPDQKAMQLLRNELGSEYRDETYEYLALKYRKRDKRLMRCKNELILDLSVIKVDTRIFT